MSDVRTLIMRTAKIMSYVTTRASFSLRALIVSAVVVGAGVTAGVLLTGGGETATFDGTEPKTLLRQP